MNKNKLIKSLIREAKKLLKEDDNARKYYDSLLEKSENKDFAKKTEVTLILDFFAEIYNGGFLQYCENDKLEDIGEVIAILGDIYGQTKNPYIHSLKILTKEASNVGRDYVDKLNERDEWGNYKEQEVGDEPDAFRELDDFVYKNDEPLLKTINTYFENNV